MNCPVRVNAAAASDLSVMRPVPVMTSDGVPGPWRKARIPVRSRQRRNGDSETKRMTCSLDPAQGHGIAANPRARAEGANVTGRTEPRPIGAS